jgi:UV DNA damage endonuclease
MSLRIGYACINTGLPSSNRTTRLDRATPERLLELARINLGALDTILRWNVAQGIGLFRISSEVIPFGSHPVNRLPWWELLQAELSGLGALIRATGMRVSMHPGQYTVLNSIRPEVVESSLVELEYHTRFLDSLGLDSSHKIILHLGGVYGDKPGSMARFVENTARLSAGARSRLVLENDERSYTLEDALWVSGCCGCPVIFDLFHHGWNPSLPGLDLRGLLAAAGKTWGPRDGRQKMHYSDPWPGKPRGSHSFRVDVEAFGRFYAQAKDLDLDVMLEVKDKEQSVLRLYEVYPELRQTSAGQL